MSLEFGHRCVLTGKICLGLAGTLLVSKLATSENFEKIRILGRYLKLKVQSLWTRRVVSPSTPLTAPPETKKIVSSTFEATRLSKPRTYLLTGELDGLPCRVILERTRGPIEETKIVDSEGRDRSQEIQEFRHYRPREPTPGLLGVVSMALGTDQTSGGVSGRVTGSDVVIPGRRIGSDVPILSLIQT